jgi:hypothetical protein
MDVFLVQCLCCQVEVSATGRSLVQRGPTDCGVSKSVRSRSAENGAGHDPKRVVKSHPKKKLERTNGWRHASDYIFKIIEERLSEELNKKYKHVNNKLDHLQKNYLHNKPEQNNNFYLNKCQF